MIRGCLYLFDIFIVFCDFGIVIWYGSLLCIVMLFDICVCLEEVWFEIVVVFEVMIVVVFCGCVIVVVF